MQQTKIILITFFLVVGLLILLMGFLISISFAYQKKKNGFEREVEDMKFQHEQALLKSELEIQDQTLQHISQEIHDNIGQHFTMAKLYLLKITGEIPEADQERIMDAIDRLTEGLEDLRGVCKTLNLELIRTAGLQTAVDNQVALLRKADCFEVDYQLIGEYDYADEKKEIFMFRILQEAINNMVRHAEARRVVICLDAAEPGWLTLSVRDDGKGFNTQKRGGGLTNMSHRAALIGADFDVQSQLGKGTTIRLRVPV